MRYAVVSPKHMLICFDHSNQVAEYCLEKDNEALDAYCKDQGLVYETMSSTEIGQTYTTIGANSTRCRIYETRELIKALRDNGAEQSIINEMNELFNNRRLNNEIDCPAYIEDILQEVSPISQAQMSDGFYTCTNIDDTNDAKDNG